MAETSQNENMSIVFLYLDKNFQFTGFGKGMPDNNYGKSSLGQTQVKTQASDVDGVLVLDQYLTVAEAKLRFSLSETQGKLLENKIKYLIRTNKIAYRKGKNKTDPIEIPMAELESILSETQAKAQAANEQSELVSSLSETIALLKSHTSTLEKIIENQSEQIQHLTNALQQSQGNLYLEKQEKQLLLQEKNQPKKGWRSWFGGE